MALAACITMLAILLYAGMLFATGAARARYKVAPPAMTGHPQFERILRVQQNTGEHLIAFIPSLWIFSQFVSSFWGGILGVIWLVGRVVYAIGYYQQPKKRMPGHIIGAVALLILIVGALLGTFGALSVIR